MNVEETFKEMIEFVAHAREQQETLYDSEGEILAKEIKEQFDLYDQLNKQECEQPFSFATIYHAFF